VLAVYAQEVQKDIPRHKMSDQVIQPFDVFTMVRGVKTDPLM
ncbi:hypothetical protein Tco_1286780, partial [Tanacetum coccineum]